MKASWPQVPLQTVTECVAMGAVIFDLDGTLADTSQDLLNAANTAFENLGYAPPLTRESDHKVAFHGGRKMLSVGIERITGAVDEDFVNANYKTLLDAYENALSVHTVFFDGVDATLDRMAAAGHRFGICTNKPFFLAEKLIDELGAAHRFDALLGADSIDVRKPDPRHYTATLKAMKYDGPSVLIGDTVTDLKTAEAAGVPCILVDFGAREEGTFDYSPYAVITSYDELPDIVDRSFKDMGVAA
ncbi:MAG: HAD-IA family hydrolase [Pseudomonadota bacterium]